MNIKTNDNFEKITLDAISEAVKVLTINCEVKKQKIIEKSYYRVISSRLTIIRYQAIIGIIALVSYIISCMILFNIPNFLLFLLFVVLLYIIYQAITKIWAIRVLNTFITDSIVYYYNEIIISNR